MRFLVISDAPILCEDGNYVAYAPYVKEMDLWMQFVNQTTFVCPTRYKRKLLTNAFDNQDIIVQGLRRLEFHALLSAMISLLSIPYQAVILWNEMRKADHIHLRAPGNLTLLACFVQILFPRKKKTAKYAGNWDPNAKQPLSYRIQKQILSNTFLTSKMQVLVYGEWEGMTKNIKSFFTASYFDREKENVVYRDFKVPLKAMFVGTMGANKRPFEAVQLITALQQAGLDISLEMYGDGPLSDEIKQYIINKGVESQIQLLGNQPSETVKEAYKKADVLILMSQSEGWPKVVAEAMFWGAIPIVSKVSCVPWMLGNGKRGILIEDAFAINVQEIKEVLENSAELDRMSKEAVQWSRQYTLDTFTKEIEKLLL